MPWEFMGYAANDIPIEIRKAWLIAMAGIKIEAEENVRNVSKKNDDLD